MLVECPSCAAKNRLPAARLGETARCGQCKTALVPVAKAATIESTEDFNDLLKGAKLPVLVDFWAPWCGPCRVVAPELERVAGDKRGQVLVAKVNTDELREVAGRYRIEAIPTMILFSRGKESKRLQGVMRAPAIIKELAL